MQSLLQTEQWASLKASQGWKVFDVGEVKVLGKSLPLGFSFLYAPEVSSEVIGDYEKFLQNLREKTQSFRPIFFRLEFLDEYNEKIVENLKKYHFIKAFEELQPEERQVLDITSSEDEILAQMKPKGRYNIKIAQKHGVKVEKVTGEGLLEGVDAFYNLFRQTAKNQGFSIRPKEYFRSLVLRLYAAKNLDLFIARYNGAPVCSLIITYYDGVASYLYGASSEENRQVMGPYLAHYEAIKEAKRRGCKTYDLLAVAPEGVENHKYSGITRFKEQFGGRRLKIVGSYDLVYKPFWYKIFAALEKRRRN